MALASHLRFAARSIVARPLFSSVVVLSLGLAIGANSAVFSLVDAALLRPVDVHEPDRLINVYTTDSGGRGFQSSSYPDYESLREYLRGVSGVFGHSGLMTTITGGTPEVVFGEIVTGNYFAVSGARIALGRAFTPDEDRVPGANPVVVISDRLWRRRFASDSRQRRLRHLVGGSGNVSCRHRSVGRRRDRRERRARPSREPNQSSGRPARRLIYTCW